MIIPNPQGQLVSLVGLPPNVDATQSAIITDLLLGGMTEPPLAGVQVDGCAGGNPSGPYAPPGQAYAWIVLDDNASSAMQTLAQNVLNARVPGAKAPNSEAKLKVAACSSTTKSSRNFSKAKGTRGNRK